MMQRQEGPFLLLGLRTLPLREAGGSGRSGQREAVLSEHTAQDGCDHWGAGVS